MLRKSSVLPACALARVGKARIYSDCVVLEDAAVRGSVQLAGFKFAHEQGGAHTAEVDPFEQCDRTAFDVHELGYALEDDRADAVLVLHLQPGARIVAPVLRWLDVRHFNRGAEQGLCRDSQVPIRSCSPMEPRRLSRKRGSSGFCRNWSQPASSARSLSPSRALPVTIRIRTCPTPSSCR